MSEERSRDKVFIRLCKNVGNDCEVSLENGTVIYGIFNGFSFESGLILMVNVPVQSSNQQVLVNFRYVTTVRFGVRR